MNKYFIILIILAVLVVGGIAIKSTKKPACVAASPQTREITIRAQAQRWNFEPSVIDVNQGDTLNLTFINEDDFDHGVGIDDYGVSQRLPAKSTLHVPPFMVTKPNDFQFYCSVSCGEGLVDGKKRGHLDQKGYFHVATSTCVTK